MDYLTLKKRSHILLYSLLIIFLIPKVLLSQPKPEDIVFEVKEGFRCFLNGKELSFPFNPAEFVEQLGETNRDDWQWRAYGLMLSKDTLYGKEPADSKYFELLSFFGVYFDSGSEDLIDFNFKGKLIICGLELPPARYVNSANLRSFLAPIRSAALLKSFTLVLSAFLKSLTIPAIAISESVMALSVSFGAVPKNFKNSLCFT